MSLATIILGQKYLGQRCLGSKDSRRVEFTVASWIKDIRTLHSFFKSFQFGLTEKEISEHFSGPAFLPWQRMGNMEVKGLKGWSKNHTILIYKIVDVSVK